MTQTISLFFALENVLKLKNAKRINDFFSLGAVSSEERGHTFGKVVGIEEAIAKHAINVQNQRLFENIVFNSVIQDDRSSSQTSNEVTINALVTIESDEFGTEIFGIDVSF
ncbi:MAG TPA: hypothetical protein EYH05_16250, partial [Anaerolineae bacterium]|nr:hypothetical protein [Anaerolineae bacterium]